MSAERLPEQIGVRVPRSRIVTQTARFMGTETNPRLVEAIGQKYPEGLVFTVPRMREFLKAAISEGAHLKTPSNTDEETWVRDRNIAGIFFLSGARKTDLAKIYGLNRERVRQIIFEVTGNLFGNSTPSTRSLFPFEQLPQGNKVKKLPGEYNLLIRGGVGNRLIEMLEQEKTPSEILSQAHDGYSHHLMERRLLTLRDLGIDMPRIVNRRLENLQLAKMLQDPSLTDEEVQKLLDQVGRHFYQVYSQGENSVLIPVLRLVMEGGFHLPNPQLKLSIQVLEDAQIPVRDLPTKVKSGPRKGELTYHFMARIHKERALNVWENANNLQAFLENPVRQICGPKVRPPTTWEIIKGKGLRAVGSLLREMGISSKNPFGLSYGELFTDNFPIPIFKYTKRGSYFYSVEQEEALRTYLLQRLNT